MPSRVEFVPSTLEHAHAIAGAMRACDVLECKVFRVTPLQALIREIDYSTTALYGGKPVAMFGCQESAHSFRTGVPWMLATEDAYLYPLSLVRYARNNLGNWLIRYETLSNWFHETNVKARAMLGHLGAEFDTKIVLDNEPMVGFTIRRS